MSNVTAEFANPDTRAAFLAKYVVFIANVAELDTGSNKAGIRKFYFWKRTDSVVDLKERMFGGGASDIKAYWLPWKTRDTTSLDMGADANFFFTSQMTGCRFSVLTKEGEPPKVAHVAGTLSKPKRDEAEGKLVTAMGGADSVRARRLSVSQTSEHGYAGQTVDPGSAFVYGVRNADDNTWTFAAQIVGANLIPNVDLAAVPSTAIKAPFSF
ncbi:MAG: hypothetical protein Q8N44_13465 [Rubrivivax sp.]|nr:hypothetical protein [Rubrivivax sp.]MDP3084679.1 hypothetical protein [Rubrivivax sp.]